LSIFSFTTFTKQALRFLDKFVTVFAFIFHIVFFGFFFRIVIPFILNTYFDVYIQITEHEIISYKKNKITNTSDTINYKVINYDDFFLSTEDGYASIYLMQNKQEEQITSYIEGDDEAIRFIHKQLVSYWDLPVSK